MKESLEENIEVTSQINRLRPKEIGYVFHPSTIFPTHPRGIRFAVTSEFHRAGPRGIRFAVTSEFHRPGPR
jgi:hypothetical protein